MQRDGFKCVLTGFWDHSVVPEGGVYRHLKCTRILKHAVPRFQNMSQSVVEGATVSFTLDYFHCTHARP